MQPRQFLAKMVACWERPAAGDVATEACEGEGGESEESDADDIDVD